MGMCGIGRVGAIGLAFLVLQGCALFDRDKAPVAPVDPVAEAPLPTPKLISAKGQEQTNVPSSPYVFFELDKANLPDNADRTLDWYRVWLTKFTDFNIRIEGNCDERGSAEYNYALGMRRAEAAKQYLVSQGVDPERIIIHSNGDENPVDPGTSERAWSRNRNAAVYLVQEEHQRIQQTALSDTIRR